MLGASIVLVLFLAGLLAPLLAPYNPYAQNLAITFTPPGLAHLFGTDEYGRDMFSRVLYGARLSQLEIMVSVGMALAIGVPLGMISGYMGGTHRSSDLMVHRPSLCIPRDRAGDPHCCHSWAGPFR